MSRYLKPPLDRIVVEPIEETESDGGILLPKKVRSDKRTQRIPTQFGKVLAVGPGPRREDGVNCKMLPVVGDTIAYYCVTEMPVTLDGKEYVVVDEAAVLAVVKGEKDAALQD